MQIQRIQNNNNNTNFGGKIIKNDYLKAGLEYAKIAHLSEQDQFINALKHIADDKEIQTFTIKAAPENTLRRKKTIIEIKGENSYYYYVNEGFFGFISDGAQCLYTIKDFIRKHYGVKTAEKVLGTKNQWLEKIDKLRTQIQYSKKQAESELLANLKKLEES